MTEVSISLNTLAAKQQSIVGIPKGNMNQLRDLVNFVAEGKVSVDIFAEARILEQTHHTCSYWHTCMHT